LAGRTSCLATEVATFPKHLEILIEKTGRQTGWIKKGAKQRNDFLDGNHSWSGRQATAMCIDMVLKE